MAGDFNIAPDDRDVYDPAKFVGSTHTSPAERDLLAQLTNWGLTDMFRGFYDQDRLYSWWDYRAGDFHQGRGLRIDLLLATPAWLNVRNGRSSTATRARVSCRPITRRSSSTWPTDGAMFDFERPLDTDDARFRLSAAARHIIAELVSSTATDDAFLAACALVEAGGRGAGRATRTGVTTRVPRLRWPSIRTATSSTSVRSSAR